MRTCSICTNPPLRWNGYCRGHYNERQRAFYKAHPEKQKANQLKYGPKYTKALKQESLNHYGKICQCCNESAFEFLGLDHINGRKQGHEIDKLRGTKLYQWLRKHNYPKDLPLRVLCNNCNSSYGTYGYCPHVRFEVTSKNNGS